MKKYYLNIIYKMTDIHTALKEIKKEEIISYYAKQTGHSEDMLNIIWECLEKIPEKKLKAIKKGNYKFKNPIKRRVIESNKPAIFENGLVEDIEPLKIPKKIEE